MQRFNPLMLLPTFPKYVTDSDTDINFMWYNQLWHILLSKVIIDKSAGCGI